MALFPSPQQSGFDLEALLGADLIKDIFLAIYEAGDFPLQFSDSFSVVSFDATILEPESVNRDYDIHPDYQAGETHPNAFNVLLEWEDAWFDDGLAGGQEPHFILQLPSDISITLGQGTPIPFRATLDLFFHVALTEVEPEDEDEETLQQLTLSVLDIGIQDNSALRTLIDPYKGLIINSLNSEVNDILGEEASFSADFLQRLVIQRYDSTNDNAACLGVYLNFLLQNGPEEEDVYPDDRANLNDAVNFLPDGNTFAISTNAGLLDRLADHIYQNFAEKQRSGRYEYEIDHTDEDDKPAKIMIKKVTLERIEGKYKLPDGSKSEKVPGLELKIKGEYVVLNIGEWEVIEPDFKVILRVYPELQGSELIWHTDHDLKINIFGGVIQKILLIGLSVAGPVGALFAGQIFLIGQFVEGILSQRLGSELLSGPIQQENYKAQRLFQESIQRLSILTKRWDPFYSTRHQVVLDISQIHLFETGIHLAGTTHVGKSYAPTEDVYIRATDPIGTLEVEEFRYKVPRNAAETLPDTPVAPATDRQPYRLANSFSIGSPINLDEEPERNIVILTWEQVRSRLAFNRLLSNILYRVVAVRLEENQIISIKSISEEEIRKIEDSWLDQYWEEEAERLQQTVTDEVLEAKALAVLGILNITNPTPEQIEKMKEEIFDTMVEEVVDERAKEELADDAEPDILASARLEIYPHTMGDLQNRQVLVLVGYDLINREGTWYYRDRADHQESDNLANQRRY